MNQQLLPPDCGLRSLFFMAGPARDDKAFAGQTSLHHVCKSAEISKLMKLLRALKAVGSDLRAMDTVDGRGFTPFHVACAGGHAQVRRSHSGVPVRAICLGQGMLTAAVPQVVETLCHAGCDTSLRNADGCTGWELAESLERAAVLALNNEELTITSQRARARRELELAGANSPTITLTKKGAGLLQHESY